MGEEAAVCDARALAAVLARVGQRRATEIEIFPSPHLAREAPLEASDLQLAERARDEDETERRRAHRRERERGCDDLNARIARGGHRHAPVLCTERDAESSKMLGGASQTVSKIRVKCNGT